MSEPAVDVCRLAIGAARAGTELTNFDEFDLVVDMRAPGSPFTFTFWRTDTSIRTENRWRALLELCKQGESVRVSIDGALQLCGLIDAVEVNTDESQSLTISGRDFAARAMDADADPKLALKGMLLPEALDRLMQDCWSSALVIVDGARQAEIQGRPQRARTHRANASTPAHRRRTPDPRVKKVDAFRIDVGDKVWSVADQLCRRLGYWLWCAPAEGTAGLVVDAPASAGPAVFALERRRGPGGSYAGNILRSKYRLDGGDVPTHVTAFASRPLDPNDDPHGRYAVVNEKYRDHPRVAHESTTSSRLAPKPRYLEPRRCSKAEHIEAAAHRCMSEAMADFETYEATVRGWGDGGGKQPNRLVHAVNTVVRVRDDSLYPPLDGLWLVTRVAFHRSMQRGTLTTLRLVPVGALEVFPPEQA